MRCTIHGGCVSCPLHIVSLYVLGLVRGLLRFLSAGSYSGCVAYWSNSLRSLVNLFVCFHACIICMREIRCACFRPYGLVAIVSCNFFVIPPILPLYSIFWLFVPILVPGMWFLWGSWGNCDVVLVVCAFLIAPMLL